MTIVERQLVARGGWYVVECAIDANGVSPAADFLRALQEGVLEPDPDSKVDELPDDAQIDDYTKFVTWAQLLADDGVPPYQRAVNDLDNGVWEFKKGSKRLTFYDTWGDGTYTPKLRYTDRRTCEYPDDDFWWFPKFDELIRLGHAFLKDGQKAPPADVTQAERIREEDLRHDRDS
ncbi:hypothetical protein [Kribbella sp. C-35]|uniref:hypothetical protein n=1 Tax=Kribbella sp. C-35 TaxID=2789276 RepID=UPI003977FB90